MAFPSLTTIGSVLFLAYMFNSLWSIGNLYFPPRCEETDTSKTVSSHSLLPNINMYVKIFYEVSKSGNLSWGSNNKMKKYPKLW